MAKTSAAAAKQAQKKHTKEVQRTAKKALMRTGRGYGVRPHSYSPQDSVVGAEERTIGAYAEHVDVPYFRAAFEVSFPAFKQSRRESYPWSLDRVAALDTDELVKRLDNLGIPVTLDDFRAETMLYRTAMVYARDAWIPRLSASQEKSTYDFVCLGAHELWKRWNDDRPSREMALEALLHMRNCQNGDDAVGLIDWGLKFWKFVAPELGPDVLFLGTLDERLDVGRGVFVLNCLDDFAELAPLVARNDRARGLPALDVLDAMDRQFSELSSLWHNNNRERIARVLAEVGQRERAEAMMREFIATYPKCAGGYVTLADFWASDGDDGKRRAIVLLEQAEALPVEDAHDYDLEDRIEALHEDIGHAGRELHSNYAMESTHRLVRWLRIMYEDAPDEIVDEIGRRGDEGVVALRNIVDDAYFWTGFRADDGATLRNAFRALGAIGSIAATEVLIASVIEHDASDSFQSTACEALANLTADAVPRLLEAAIDGRACADTRSDFIRAAYAIAVRIPDRRSEVTAFVLNELRTNDAERQWCVVDVALRMDDPAVKEAVETLVGNTDVLDKHEWEAALRHREDGPWVPIRARDTDSFDKPEAAIVVPSLKKSLVTTGSRTNLSVAHVPRTPATATLNSKLGRNDPCPCGSGKKYKKCCMS